MFDRNASVQPSANPEVLRWVVADMLASGRLVALNTEFDSLKRCFYLLRHKQKHVTPGLQRFIDFLLGDYRAGD